MAVVSQRLGDAMRLVDGERVSSWVDVFYSDTGAQFVDHFEVVNNFDTDMTVVVYDADGVTEITRQAFAPGTHTVAPPRPMRWNKPARTTDFSLAFA